MSNDSQLILALTAFSVIVNLSAFFLVWNDKQKSITRGERFPEVYFFFISIFFASPGVLLGMYTFRHKTRKAYFPIGLGLLFLEQLTLVLYITHIL